MPRAHNSFVDGGGDGSCIRLLDEVIQGHVSAARLSQHVAGLAAGGPREAVRAAEQLDALVAFADLPWDADTQVHEDGDWTEVRLTLTGPWDWGEALVADFSGL